MTLKTKPKMVSTFSLNLHSKNPTTLLVKLTFLSIGISLKLAWRLWWENGWKHKWMGFGFGQQGQLVLDEVYTMRSWLDKWKHINLLSILFACYLHFLVNYFRGTFEFSKKHSLNIIISISLIRMYFFSIMKVTPCRIDKWLFKNVPVKNM